MIAAPGFRNGSGQRPTANLRDAPIAIVGERDGKLFFQARKWADILDAGGLADGFDVAAGEQHRPVLLRRRHQQDGGIQSVQTFQASEKNEVVIFTMRDLELEPPRLRLFHRENQHGSARHGLHNATAAFRKGALEFGGVEMIQIEFGGARGFGGVIVIEWPDGARRLRGCGER